MEFSPDYKDQTADIIALFRAAFAASEGAAEGDLIAGLVKDMFQTTRDRDLFVFSAWDKGSLAGCIIFSRQSFEQDDRTVFLLSPVAVETSRQGQGVGQALLNHGLAEIRKKGIDIAVTYGNPDYYSIVGFQQITEQEIQAPQPLQFPHGWLAQSLTSAKLTPLAGPSRCVEALNNPEYW